MSVSGSIDLAVSLLRNASGTEVTAGRVTTFTPDDTRGSVAGVTITEGPEHGNLTVNPDGTLALVLTTSDYTGPLSFDYTLRYADGSTEARSAKLKVVPGSQKNGWGEGEHYRLQTDEDGRSIVEPGENHRKVHISADNGALSRADIAAREGISVNQIDGEWLRDHPQYGATEGQALDQEAGLMLWEELTRKAEPSSHWLLLERGHEYDELGNFIVQRQTTGESELHPVLIGAYGDGDKPLVTSYMRIYKEPSDNVVVRDIAFQDGIQVLSGRDLLFENISVSGDSMMNVQGVDRFTLRDAEIFDVVREESATEGVWGPGSNKISGIFVSKTDGVLIEESLFDHNGWADGYDPNGSTNKPQPPSFFSHNVYIQRDNTDVTFRDNIVMRGASFGAQIRPGGHIEDNVFLDNNAAVNFLGGPSGNYTLFADNVVTSGAHKQWNVGGQGAMTKGIDNASRDATLIDNIVAHLEDPNNPAEQAWKAASHDALKNHHETFYDDTIIYNWLGEAKPWRPNPDQNLDGLDPAQLDRTTIQLYAEQLTGKNNATIGDLANYLRAQAKGDLDGVGDADLIIAFFQAGFEIAPGDRTGATTLRFIPDERGDGIRWDNRLNWSTDDLPGTAKGDSVDLGGNWVRSTATATVKNLDFGSGGELTVGGGYIGVTGTLDIGSGGGTLATHGAGQFWTAGYADADRLTVTVDGGRFANTGTFDGNVDMTMTAGEALLATGGARFVLDDGDRLAIEGGKAGFDGPGGEALLRLEGGTLEFAVQGSTTGHLGEFRSGHWGVAEPGVRSVVDLGAAEATLALDLSGMGVRPLDNELIQADILTGGFGDIDVSGLGGGTGVKIGIDYAQDVVTLTTGSAPKGEPRLQLTYKGSDDTDTFQIGDLDEFFANVLDFAANDRLDVTGLLAAEGAGRGAVSFRSVDTTHTDLLVGGDAMLRLTHTSRIDDFGVSVQGGRTVVSAGKLGPVDPGEDDAPPTAPEAPPTGGDGEKPPAEPGNPANRAPTAQASTVSAQEDRSHSGVLSADDPDGDDLSFSLAKATRNGSVEVNGDGSFSYVPATNFHGTDSFTYRVTDGDRTDTATVSIKVAAVNDRPEAGNDAVATGATGRFTTGDLLKNDSDIDGDRLKVAGIATEGTKGKVTDNGDGTFDYDPGKAFADLAAGKTAKDSFTYTVTDGNGGTDTATVTITLTGEESTDGGNGGSRTIRGTDGRDILTGTSSRDWIESLGGSYDRMTGGGGADHFVFGTETRNGITERDVIADYEMDADQILLDEAIRIRSVEDTSSGAVLLLEGDSDRIYVNGDGVTADALTILVGDDATPYDWSVL